MKGRPPTKEEKHFWDLLARHVGCIACYLDGYFNDYCSIHHIDGRTKPDAHKLVLPLCAGHHQKGTGSNPNMIAVHPDKFRFQEKYGSQMELLQLCKDILRKKGVNSVILDLGQ